MLIPKWQSAGQATWALQPGSSGACRQTGLQTQPTASAVRAK